MIIFRLKPGRPLGARNHPGKLTVTEEKAKRARANQSCKNSRARKKEKFEQMEERIITLEQREQYLEKILVEHNIPF